MVTGADGFIGSHLVERLVVEGAHVRAFCHYNSRGSLGWLDESDARVRSAIDIRLGDIRDAGFVAASMTDVEIVFHLAALIAIPYSYAAPQSFIDTNVTGTLHVLEAARRVGVGQVIQTSTSEVYGTPLTLPIIETHALNAQSPYAASKIAGDQLALAFHRTYDVPITVIRPFNTYGPRQSARAVLPSIIEQLLGGVDEVHLGRLDPRRDMTYVEDTVDGFVLAALVAPGAGEVIQLGTGRDVSIAELFEIVRGIIGSDATVIEDRERVRPDASEVQVLRSDPEKARRMLGWSPSHTLEEGLAATVAWFADRPRMAEVQRDRR